MTEIDDLIRRLEMKRAVHYAMLDDDDHLTITTYERERDEAATALAALRTRAETAERERSEWAETAIRRNSEIAEAVGHCLAWQARAETAERERGELTAAFNSMDRMRLEYHARAIAAEARVRELSAAPDLPGLRRAVEIAHEHILSVGVIAALRAEIARQEAVGSGS